jgi:hypothetical protein
MASEGSFLPRRPHRDAKAHAAEKRVIELYTKGIEQFQTADRAAAHPGADK